MSRYVALGETISAISTSGTGPTVVVMDGAVTTLVVTSGAIATGVIKHSFTPDQTGLYTLVADGVVVGEYEVVGTTPLASLRNLEDQALGTWEWDKTTKEMTLYRQDGTVLRTFEAEDTLELALPTESVMDATREQVIAWAKENECDFQAPVFPPPNGWYWAENAAGLTLCAVFTVEGEDVTLLDTVKD